MEKQVTFFSDNTQLLLTQGYLQDTRRALATMHLPHIYRLNFQTKRHDGFSLLYILYSFIYLFFFSFFISRRFFLFVSDTVTQINTIYPIRSRRTIIAPCKKTLRRNNLFFFFMRNFRELLHFRNHTVESKFYCV